MKNCEKIKKNLTQFLCIVLVGSECITALLFTNADNMLEEDGQIETWKPIPLLQSFQDFIYNLETINNNQAVIFSLLFFSRSPKINSGKSLPTTA